ncbi:MAG: serine--tRNA ligase [Ignavibacteria bacterium]|nr:serine--tRNA ligase [Ignavibacteria bacterium]
MISIKEIRDNHNSILHSLNKRGNDFSNILSEILLIDSDWRKANQEFESARNKQNELTKKFAKDTSSSNTKNELKLLSESTKSLEKEATFLKSKMNDLLLSLPNIPDEDLLPGGKENNEVLKAYGSATESNFKQLDHMTLCRDLNLIDYDRGVKLAGTGNWLYWGKGAVLEWALINYFISEHLKSGYRFVLPPHILTYSSGIGAGQFPKFADDVFLISRDNNALNEEQKFLLPTSETALVNIYRDEILLEKSLPIKLFSYTPCYRKEAGGYRSDEKGTIRGHQFNKVEMFHFAHPDKWRDSFDELVENAAKLVESLGLHYRVTKLAAGDVSASMKRTYDIEVYIPSHGYKEVSSVSNAGNYQAIRTNVRFRNTTKGKLDFVYTLNGSGLATSRLFTAIVEQFQDSKGGIMVPQVLQKWFGEEYIAPINKEKI